LDTYLSGRTIPAASVAALMPKINLQQTFSESVANMKQQGAGADHPKFGHLLKHL
jgi:hypothetical protein